MTINPYTQGHQVVRCIGRFRSVREILKRQRHLRSIRKTTATFATGTWKGMTPRHGYPLAWKASETVSGRRPRWRPILKLSNDL